MPENRSSTGIVAYIACLMFLGASLAGGAPSDVAEMPLASAISFNAEKADREPVAKGAEFRIEINGRSYVARIVGELPNGPEATFRQTY